MEVENPIFDLQTAPWAKSNDIEEIEWNRVYPNEAPASFSTAATLNFEFKNTNTWVLLNEAYLEIDCSITQANGNPLTNVLGSNSGTGPVLTDSLLNLTPSALQCFSKGFLYLNNNMLGYVENPSDCNLFTALTSYSEDYLNSVANEWGLILDSQRDADPNSATAIGAAYNNAKSFAGAEGALYPTYGGLPNVFYNEGSVKRTKLYTSVKDFGNAADVDPLKRPSTSKIANFIVPLREMGFGLLKSYPRVVKSDFKLTLHRNEYWTSAIYGQVGSGDTAPKITINGLALWIPQVKPSIAQQAKLANLMSVNPKIEHRYAELLYQSKQFSQSPNVEQTYMLSSIVNKPLKCFVSFRLLSRLNNYNANSGIFDHMNIREISIRVNGHLIPKTSYQLRGSQRDVNRVARLLQDTYISSGVSQDVASGVCLKPDTWNVYPIYVFDLSSMPPTIFSEFGGRNNMGMTVHWTQSDTYGTGDFLCYAVVECERKVSIDVLQNQISFVSI